LRSGSLEEQLGYRFSDPHLLKTALTHRSVGRENYERLEFLGDSVLGLCISEQLYHLFPSVEEGDLSRLRASLVNRESLAEIGAQIDIGEQLHLGGGELKSGGFRRVSILADAVEAVIGAVYLDGGFSPCREVINGLYRDRLKNLPPPHELKDPKTRLQETLQGRGHALPIYEVVAVTGKEHDQNFKVSCRVPETSLSAHGQGQSRRKAEQAAASGILELFTDEQ